MRDVKNAPSTGASSYQDPYPGRKGADRITEACGACGGTGIYSAPSRITFYTSSVGDVTTGCFACGGAGTRSFLVSSARSTARRRARLADEARDALARIVSAQARFMEENASAHGALTHAYGELREGDPSKIPRTSFARAIRCAGGRGTSWMLPRLPASKSSTSMSGASKLKLSSPSCVSGRLPSAPFPPVACASKGRSPPPSGWRTPTAARSRCSSQVRAGKCGAACRVGLSSMVDPPAATAWRSPRPSSVVTMTSPSASSLGPPSRSCSLTLWRRLLLMRNDAFSQDASSRSPP